MTGNTRYCSTCGALLSVGAALCGECGARYQASPYERRATDAPVAWQAAPRRRAQTQTDSADNGQDDTGIQLLSQGAAAPSAPRSTALRSRGKYDHTMATENHAYPTGSPAQSGNATASPARDAEANGPALEYPLDGCEPASLAKRFLAALLDGVIASILLLPLMIGVTLIMVEGEAKLLAQILMGVGAMLPAAYTVLMIWLVGAKGFTLGKAALGLRVTRTSEGGKIGFLRSLGRWAVYNIFSPLMALSIFFDPQRVLRGFHDRVVDSVVTDIRAGRNPMKPRPDDFERPPNEEYLGRSSVAVSAHENLMAAPGSAWASAQEPQQSDAQPAYDPWAPPPAPSPAPSSASEAPAHTMHTSAWGEQVGASSAAWGQQSAAPAWQAPEQAMPAPAPQQPWGQPEPSAQSMYSASPAPSAPSAQPAPSAPPLNSWEPPQAGPEAQPWQAPVVEPEPAQQPWQAPGASAPAPSGYSGSHRAAQPTGGITGGAWGEEMDDVEQTRMSQADDEDLESTRVSVGAVPPARRRLRVVTDNGEERLVESPLVIGRNPSSSAGDTLFILKDESRSVSKTHLRIDGTGEKVMITDLGSTNGSSIISETGGRTPLLPDTPTELPQGATVAIGDRTLTVEQMP